MSNSKDDKHLMRSTLNALPIRVAVIDNKGLIRYTNQSWERFEADNCLAVGQSNVGSNYLKAIQKAVNAGNDKALIVLEGIKDVINARKEEFVLEYDCPASKQQRWFKMRATPFQESGKTVITHENITERRLEENREEEMKKFNAKILNNLEELIIYLDPDLNVKWANQGAKDYFGLSTEKMNDQPCYQKWGLDSYCQGCPIIKTKQSKERREKIMEKPDGSTWLMKSIPDFDENGEIKGVIEVCLDISKQKKAEDKIQQVASKLEEQFEKAGKLHDQFLPVRTPKFDYLSIGTYYAPADRLGGDFYNFIELENKLIFYISDVSGHDLSGSMLNIFLKETINAYLIAKNRDDDISSAEMMNFINKHFSEENFPADYFICLTIGIMDLDSKEVEICNAGIQFYPLLIKEKDGITSISCEGMPISYASFEFGFEYEVCQFVLKPGNIIFLYTDGLAEQSNGHQMYGEERILKLLNNNSALQPEEIIEEVNADFNNFKGDMSVQDDITYLLIQHDKKI